MTSLTSSLISPLPSCTPHRVHDLADLITDLSSSVMHPSSRAWPHWPHHWSLLFRHAPLIACMTSLTSSLISVTACARAALLMPGPLRAAGRTAGADGAAPVHHARAAAVPAGGSGRPHGMWDQHEP